MFKRLPQDIVLEHLEHLNSTRLKHPFRFPRFTNEWRIERKLAKDFLRRCGNWKRALWALDIMFHDERLRWKTRPSFKACFSDLRYVLAIIEKESAENEKKWERLSQEGAKEDLFSPIIPDCPPS